MACLIDHLFGINEAMQIIFLYLDCILILATATVMNKEAGVESGILTGKYLTFLLFYFSENG
jgi:hypothetical protein